MTGIPIPPGEGQTPGFWKNHLSIFEQETGLSRNDTFESVFGVDVRGTKWVSTNPTLAQALGAEGGGEAALLRAATAGLANALSDQVNYSFIYPLEVGLAEVFNLDPTAEDFFAQWIAAKEQIFPTLEKIDTNDDFSLSADEIILAVKDVYDDPEATTDCFSWDDRGAVALALDVMNNMPSEDASAFLA